VLTELFIRATPTLTEMLSLLQTTHGFRFLPFDYKAAVECGALLRGRGSSAKRAGTTWGKVKFDHQIVAIARAEGADIIYSDDSDVKTLGAAVGIEVKGVWDLPAKPVEAQGKLPLPE
jgi:CRISPR-associated DxTHG motif protein